MAHTRGITCPSCGASTPLPEDLRTPTFACAFCAATLETARFAGAAAVSADALGQYLRDGVGKPPEAVDAFIREAPQFQGGSEETRAAACKRCSAPVAVPMDVSVRTFRCGGCGVEQPVNAYIPDQERFEADMARQTAGNEALKRLRAEGVACSKCGGHNQVPASEDVQFPCHFCGAPVLLADHVDATAVARHRLAGQVFALKDELMQKHEAQQRRERVVAFAILGVLLLVGLGVSLLSRL